MNVDSILKALLDKLGVPVERLKYGGRADCFMFTGFFGTGTYRTCLFA